MKIENINYTVTGSSVWNQGREPGDELLVDLNIGGIDDELQERYVAIAEDRLSDELSDDEVQYELSHGIWDELCSE